MSRPLRCFVRSLVLFALSATHTAYSQPRAAASASVPKLSQELEAKQAPPPEPGSPRHGMQAYLEHARRGAYGEAAKYLQLTPAQQGLGAGLSERLKFALDRHGALALVELSPLATGDLADGLSPSLERVGSVARADGREDPILLRRIGYGKAARWVFAQESVRLIDEWYGELDERWLLEKLPASLLRAGPFNVPRWQWLALPSVLFLSWLGGIFLSRIARGILGSLAKRTAAEWDDRLVARTGAPLTLIWTSVLYMASLPWLRLYDSSERWVSSVLHVLIFIGAAWVLVRAADVAADSVAKGTWANAHPGSRALIPLGSRVMKVLLIVLASLALLATLGYPVTTLVAGLGIGGLALALAAQKTVENLFGALSIGVDQPLREGDYVDIEGVQGTVEAIGLRSTRIRSINRTLIAIPNGKLAEMRIESYAVRDRIRLACRLGLAYETTSEQLRQVLAGLEGVLKVQEKVWNEEARVHFVGYSESSLDLEVEAWFETTDAQEFMDIRQQILLAFMGVVEGAGTAFAHPMRTVHVASLPVIRTAAG